MAARCPWAPLFGGYARADSRHQRQEKRPLKQMKEGNPELSMDHREMIEKSTVHGD